MTCMKQYLTKQIEKYRVKIAPVFLHLSKRCHGLHFMRKKLVLEAREREHMVKEHMVQGIKRQHTERLPSRTVARKSRNSCIKSFYCCLRLRYKFSDDDQTAAHMLILPVTVLVQLKITNTPDGARSPFKKDSE